MEKVLNNNLRGVRNEKHVTQMSLSKAIGVSDQHIRNIETSYTNPTIKHVLMICEFLEIEIKEVFYLTDKK